MNSCLIKWLIPLVIVIGALFSWNSHLDESDTRLEALLLEKFVLDDVEPVVNFVVLLFQLLNQFLSLPWAKTAQKLNLVVHVLMINNKIQVNTNAVEVLNVDLLQNLHQPCLVDVSLHRMKSEVESLVLTHDGTPKIENLIHGILFVSCQTDRFFQDKRMVFQKFLTVVR